ncbi:hypothetical protein [Ramlibacter tataouinensis]|nr:hypothetical protein [Ramlibacter tataouinensis]
MNRWIKPLLAAALLAAGAALAQGIVREAPKDVKPARLKVTAAPQALVNGRPDRLSPGARIRNLNNLVVLPASLAGQDLPMVYRRDAAGLVHEVWLLSEAEYARLGGTRDVGGAEGLRRFNELLALVFGGRR